MKKTKIDWCDCTVNPVVGCPNGCEWCYGRRINSRFGIIPNWDCPQFFPDRLKEFGSKKSKSVFIDSMSDIGTWEPYWFDRVMDALVENKQHNYVALTKTSLNAVVKRVFRYMTETNKQPPLFLGKSITTQAQADVFDKQDEAGDFLSIEPLLERIDVSKIVRKVRTIIIGAETGNRKGKVVPLKEWVDEIVREADKEQLHVFMKESLRGIMGSDFRQDKLPWEVER